MPVQPQTLYTPNEAAVLTHLSLKAVHNAIDRKTVPTMPGRGAGRHRRLLDRRALLMLTLERRLANRFQPELRREVFKALENPACNAVSLEGGFLKIDLREPKRELAASLRELRQAARLVHSDPGIMGGQPVFRGTRLPVHLIAERLTFGEDEASFLESLPSLTKEMMWAAPIYDEAYPYSGRPVIGHPYARGPVTITRVKWDKNEFSRR